LFDATHPKKESGINTLVGGALGGAIIWGQDTPITSQINMYIMSRVTMAIVRVCIRLGYVAAYKYAFTLYASVFWALVMYLYHYQDGTLQRSLISSMTYIYTDSNRWPKNVGVLEWFRRDV